MTPDNYIEVVNGHLFINGIEVSKCSYLEVKFTGDPYVKVSCNFYVPVENVSVITDKEDM